MREHQSLSKTRMLTLGAIFTAFVIILQSFCIIRFGIFEVSLVLIPIVLGAAICGKYIGAWLGFVFGAVVLISGQAAPFLAFSIPGTIITVLLKGTVAGFISGLFYELICRKNQTIAIIVSTLICPIVNTGVFLICCFAFFMPLIKEWAAAFGYGGNIIKYAILSLVGGNFFFELVLSTVLSPVLIKLIALNRKIH